MYNICQNLYKIIEDKTPSTPPMTKKKNKDSGASIKTPAVIPPELSTRRDGYQRRAQVRHLADQEENKIMEDKDASILILVEQSPEEVERLSFKDNVIMLAKEYRKPFRNL